MLCNDRRNEHGPGCELLFRHCPSQELPSVKYNPNSPNRYVLGSVGGGVVMVLFTVWWQSDPDPPTAHTSCPPYSA
jgi:hypothetical protein